MLIFDIHWTNEGSANIDIGPDFVVYKYDKDKPIKLEQKGIWELYLEILAGEVMNADDGFVFQHQRTTSYNLSAHYDVLTPGKYRFEAHGAWVEFQIIDDLSDFSVINDGKGGQQKNKTHLFDSIKDVYVYLTENGIYIGNI